MRPADAPTPRFDASLPGSKRAFGMRKRLKHSRSSKRGMGVHTNVRAGCVKECVNILHKSVPECLRMCIGSGALACRQQCDDMIPVQEWRDFDSLARCKRDCNSVIHIPATMLVARAAW